LQITVHVHHCGIATVNYCTVKYSFSVVWEDFYVHASLKGYCNINQIYLKGIIRFCVLCTE